MDKKILFTEDQKFRQWWILLIIAFANISFLISIYLFIADGQWGKNKTTDNVLVVGILLVAITTILLLNFRLETRITQDGVFVRFFPIHIKLKHYAWNNLSKCFVRKYSPVREYGGWGIRISLSGNGNAYNVSGDKGLQLELVSRKRLLIGTKKPEELNAVLESLGQVKN